VKTKFALRSRTRSGKSLTDSLMSAPAEVVSMTIRMTRVQSEHAPMVHAPDMHWPEASQASPLTKPVWVSDLV
jgi:hypothetical protein